VCTLLQFMLCRVPISAIGHIHTSMPRHTHIPARSSFQTITTATHTGLRADGNTTSTSYVVHTGVARRVRDGKCQRPAICPQANGGQQQLVKAHKLAKTGKFFSFRLRNRQLTSPSALMPPHIRLMQRLHKGLFNNEFAATISSVDLLRSAREPFD